MMGFIPTLMFVGLDTNSMGGGDVRKLIDARVEHPGGIVESVVVLEVPTSEKYPEGIKYRMHLGTKEGRTLVRFDNSHGEHHKHVRNDIEDLEDFPGLQELLDDFYEAVDEELGRDSRRS